MNLHMNNKVTLDKWMASVWLVPVEGAEKYHLGQRLNKKEANEIKHLIAQSAEFDLNSKPMRCGILYHGHPYRDFLQGYVGLLLAVGRDDVNGWRKSLWKALEDMDKVAIKQYVQQVYHVDIGMLLGL